MKKRNVQFCTKNKVCCSCGFCEDICPTNAITIEQHNYMYAPKINKSKCMKCGLCYEICSGKGNNWYEKACLLNQRQTVKNEFIEDLGFQSACYLAYSNDYEIRFHCASGGVTSTLLIYMLEKKIIDGAVVTRFTSHNPFDVETVIATTKQEILEAKSSKYCPVHMNGIIKQLKEFDGKVAFVGLPCQIQTLRNIENKYKWLQEKIYLHIGLFCSGTKDNRGLDYLLLKNGIKKDGITKFAYRDDGYFGNVKATYSTNYMCVPFVQAYSVMHSYFKPERCVTCIDHFAYLSDISLGDIDCEPYNKDTIGSNSVIIRTEKAENIFNMALNDKIIEATNIFASEIIRSQNVLNFRKTLFVAYRFIYRILCKFVPEYDVLPNKKIGIKGIKLVFSYKIQRLASKLKINK